MATKFFLFFPRLAGMLASLSKPVCQEMVSQCIFIIMKNLSLLILSFLLLLFAFNVYASDSISSAERLELRQRLDSLEVEKQTLKRLGKPLSELETAAAQLRDTLSTMRVHTVSLEQHSSDKSFSLPFSLPASLSGISFAPRNLFDWFIIAVGVVALLSGFLLVIGIIHAARAKKRRTAVPKAKAVKTKDTKDKTVKRMNLAPQENYTVQAPEIPKIAPTPMPAHTPEPAPQMPPPSFGGYDFAGRRPSLPNTETQNKKETMGDTKTIALLRERIMSAPAPEQQTAAVPLFVNDDQPPPPKTAPVSAAPPAAANAQELVMAASKEGLNAQEISKRHQISIDQVNLILRMAKK